MQNLIDPAICNWAPAFYFIFSENVAGTFLYYAHFFPAISGLLISLFVLRSNPKSKAAQALFFTIIMFVVWCFMSLTTWASDRPDIIMFVWEAMIYFELLFYVGAFYFIYAFFKGKFPSTKMELGIFTIFLPLLLLGHTNLNLLGFDFRDCFRNAVEGPLWQYYVYGFEILFVLFILVISIQEVIKRRRENGQAREATLVAIGVLALLSSFSLGNIIGSFFDNWNAGSAGLFGMPVFVAFLGYILVRYKTFQVKLLATEALMAGQLILLSSLLFVRTIEHTQLIAIVTIIFFSTLGAFLIKSVRNEIKQREKIEILANTLEESNERLKIVDQQKSEFVSIASHQLRSPLTAIRGYASMMNDGNFGTPPEAMKEPIARIVESAKLMSLSIEDFLNVSRIESGNIKYDTSDFNLKMQVEHVVTDLRTEAVKLGLNLEFKDDSTLGGYVYADQGKVQQILHNLINNAIKYTPEGSVHVHVYDNKAVGMFYVDISDTGIGIAPEATAKLFQKFSRAKNANSVNTSGTGLGLFVGRAMARAMGGEITAYSDGEGKGARFVLSLPLRKR